jgi:hypothetical protein
VGCCWRSSPVWWCAAAASISIDGSRPQLGYGEGSQERGRCEARRTFARRAPDWPARAGHVACGAGANLAPSTQHLAPRTPARVLPTSNSVAADRDPPGVHAACLAAQGRTRQEAEAASGTCADDGAVARRSRSSTAIAVAAVAAVQERHRQHLRQTSPRASSWPAAACMSETGPAGPAAHRAASCELVVPFILQCHACAPQRHGEH